MFRTATALIILMTFASKAELIYRGNDMFYDTRNDITWIGDGKIAQTLGFDDDGLLQFNAATRFVESLSYGGFDDWRLPTLVVRDTNLSGTDDCDFSYANTDCGYNLLTTNSELVSLFYLDFEIPAYYDRFGTGPQNEWVTFNEDRESFLTKRFEGGQFDNIFPSEWYWTGYRSEYFGSYNYSWAYLPSGGLQADYPQDWFMGVLAVRDGDVVTVNEPRSFTNFVIFGLACLSFFFLKNNIQRRQIKFEKQG